MPKYITKKKLMMQRVRCLGLFSTPRAGASQFNCRSTLVNLIVKPIKQLNACGGYWDLREVLLNIEGSTAPCGKTYNCYVFVLPEIDNLAARKQSTSEVYHGALGGLSRMPRHDELPLHFKYSISILSDIQDPFTIAVDMYPPPESDSPLPPNEYEPLPSSVWSLGVHDAHCHPTDTMSMTQTIPSMKASGLIIMSTRSQDQALVIGLAEKYGVYDPRDPEESRGKVIPSFGYHPWFSYLIWDDEVEDLKKLSNEERKILHYQKALTPNPSAELIATLPEPRKLSDVIKEVRGNLERFPIALVGEIGLDRGFRIPFPPGAPLTKGPAEANDKDVPEQEEDVRLSPHRVSMEHQKRVFVSQLKLAGELQRAVSVHGVQCHGALFDTFRDLWKGHEFTVESRKEMKRRRRKGKDGHQYLPDFGDDEDEADEENMVSVKGDEDYSWLQPKKSQPTLHTSMPKPFPPRVCLHSFSAPSQTLQQYLTPPSAKHRYPSYVYFSFSTTINARPVKGHVGKIMETIRGAPEDRVLVESDLHMAGEGMDKALEGAVRLIASVRGVELSDCTKKLSDNWKEFVFGLSDSEGNTDQV